MPDLDPVDVDFAETASHLVRVERIVDATPERLWDALVETTGWTEWFPTMSRADSPAQQATLGTERTVKVGGLVAHERVVVADQPTRWGFTLLHTNLPIAKRMLDLVDLEDVGDEAAPRTRVRYVGAFEPTWFTRPFAGLVKRSAARAWRHGLDGLAAHVGA